MNSNSVAAIDRETKGEYGRDVVDESDWRLTDQESYLRGIELQRRPYRPYPRNPSWDHDHCSFCWAEFAADDRPDVLHEGYATLDEYRWICPTCFEDFRERFGWIVVATPGS